jgi:hypothetical protein
MLNVDDSLHSFYFRDPPILHSPVLPIPGQRSQEAKDIGSSMAALPKYMGQTFSTFCQFWTLAQEMAVLYLGQDERTLAERVPLAFAESKYQKLLAWTNTVAESMALNDHSPAHVMIFQYDPRDLRCPNGLDASNMLTYICWNIVCSFTAW